MQFKSALLAIAASLSVAAAANVGQATFFSPGLGACGHFNTDADFIVAVSSQFFTTFPGAGANPNKNPLCNKKLTATRGKKSVTVTIVDECPGCAGKFDLDLSPAAFKKLGSESEGRLSGIKWVLH